MIDIEANEAPQCDIAKRSSAGTISGQRSQSMRQSILHALLCSACVCVCVCVGWSLTVFREK
jgi:hypothetical protein